MFKGVLQVKSKPFRQSNMFYISLKRMLFIFDDAIAIADPSAAAVFTKVVGGVVGHHAGLAGDAMLLNERARLKREVGTFSSDLTVEQLGSRVGVDNYSYVPILSILSVHLTTALYPATQLRGVDLQVNFERWIWSADKVNRRAAGILQEHKHHITTNPSEAVNLLTSVLLPTQIRDRRFEWART